MEQSPNLSQLARLAQTEEGQQLLRLLRQSNGKALQDAAALASQGDYTAAQKLLSAMLSSPQAQTLLKQLEAQL